MPANSRWDLYISSIMREIRAIFITFHDQFPIHEKVLLVTAFLVCLYHNILLLRDLFRAYIRTVSGTHTTQRRITDSEKKYYKSNVHIIILILS